MKKFIKKFISSYIIKKRVLLINSVLFTVIILFFIAGCIKEDYPVRLVFPVLTTIKASDTTATTAISGGNITYDGGKALTARGVCWGTTLNPSITYPDSLTVDGTEIGQYTSTITGLAPNKKYHIRAYATNPDGTSYGQDVSFTTLDVTK